MFENIKAERFDSEVKGYFWHKIPLLGVTLSPVWLYVLSRRESIKNDKITEFQSGPAILLGEEFFYSTPYQLADGNVNYSHHSAESYFSTIEEAKKYYEHILVQKIRIYSEAL